MKPWAWPEKGGPQPVRQSDLDTPQPQTAQEAPFRRYHYVLRIEIVAEGAIIKIDFIEGLSGEPDHLTLVEAPILVLANDLLARSDALQGSLGALEKTEAWVTPQTGLANGVPHELVPLYQGNIAKRWNSKND